MSKVTVTSCANDSYEGLAYNWLKSVRNFDYQPRMYDLGGLNFNIDFKKRFGYQPKTPREIYRAKLACMKDAYYNTKNLLVWIDADAFIAKPFPEMVTGDYDIALYARLKDKGKVKFKAGVIFFRHTPGARKFLDRVVDTFPDDVRGDQQWINQIIAQYYRVNRPVLAFETIDVDGTRIKILDSTYHHEIHSPEDFENEAKIIHFSGTADEGQLKLPSKLQLMVEYENSSRFPL